MTQYYNLLSDKEAVIWIMQHAFKPKNEAQQIVDGFRKSYRARGVADRMKIHAEVLPGCRFNEDIEKKGTTPGNLNYLREEFYVEPTVHSLVSWLPVPFIGNAKNRYGWETEELAEFKQEAKFPDWYEVSFGFITNVAGMALAHFQATGMDPLDGYPVRTDTDCRVGLWDYPVEVRWCKKNNGLNFEICAVAKVFPHGTAFFPVGVVKRSPIIELIPEKYEVLDYGEEHKFEMKDLEFFSCLNPGEHPVGGRKIRQRAVEQSADFSLPDAKYVLDHHLEIPANIRSIIFPGTRLLSKSNAQVIPYVHLEDNSPWRLGFLGVESTFYKQDHLVRFKQNAETTKGETP